MKCCYCQRELDKDIITKEHIVPVSMGGNNSKLNIRDCCKFCNGLRGNKPLFVFRFQFKRSIKKGKLYKNFSLEQMEKVIRNTYVIEKFINENMELLTTGEIKK